LQHFQWKLTAFLTAVCIFVGVPIAYCQTNDDALKARTLYYTSGEDDVRPATKRTVTTKPPKPSDPPPSAAAANTSVAPPKPVSHLGLRYNVLLIDPETAAEQFVDPDKTFHANDCFALQVQSNYGGYLYVFNRGSSGKWSVMLPSEEMPGEANLVGSRTSIKIPAEHCFSIDQSAGVEHLFVVFSRDPQDVEKLNSTIKSSRLPPSSNSSSSDIAATAGIGVEVARIERHLQSRDLTIKKIAQPIGQGERAQTVFVVNTSNDPSERLVSEIQIRHN
jgi:hypothetical protein